MTAEGQIELEGKSHRVRGTTWMDHEFGSSWLAPQQVGWDWFALQMKDGRELMLFILRNKNKGMDFAHATLVSDDGRVKYMKKSEWDLVENQTWISKTSGGQYPAGWRIRVGGEQWSVRPRFADQENRSRLRPGLVYWEGAITVEDLQGRSVGSGYVELTGYAPGSRPPL